MYTIITNLYTLAKTILTFVFFYKITDLNQGKIKLFSLLMPLLLNGNYCFFCHEINNKNLFYLKYSHNKFDLGNFLNDK